MVLLLYTETTKREHVKLLELLMNPQVSTRETEVEFFKISRW